MVPVLPPARTFDPIENGDLSVRLAVSEHDLRLAQRLRYDVFCGEIGAKASDAMRAQARDFDEFDPWCDHLLVEQKQADGSVRVVGTYRLLLQERAEALGRFYTEGEYDVTCLKSLPIRLLELGRSCVEKEFRVRPVLQLLWRGIGAYVLLHKVELMFGCASFPGADPDQHAEGLTYLATHHVAEGLCPRALPHLYTEMKRLPSIDERAFHRLPPLLKGYLRLGGSIGDGAVRDLDYNTTDVCIIVKTDRIAEKYAAQFLPDTET